MRRWFWMSLIVIIFACNDKPDKKVQTAFGEIIERLEERFSPDNRVAIFRIGHEWKGDQVVVRGETNLPKAYRELKMAMFMHGYKIIDSIKVLEPDLALVNVSVCNIRSNPKHSAELATQSLLGTPLKIYKKDNGWYYVQTPDGYLGWLDGGALEVMSQTMFDQWINSSRVVVSENADFVRSSLDKSIISDVSEGDILRHLGSQGQYFQVALPDGRAGILPKSSTEPYKDFLKPQEPLLENIISTAKEFMGRPYLWGGTSGRAVDCSGFTKTVFYLNGLVLPRDASQQVHVGLEIETDTTLRNLQLGDFLFFGRKASDGLKEKITHVGIYLGDGRMIHSSKRVRVQSLRRGDPDFAEHRLMTFVRAKRMLENIGENGVIPLNRHSDYAGENDN